MNRRVLLSMLAIGARFAARLAASDQQPVLRGKLTHQGGGRPAIETASHQTVFVTGDKPTQDVLKDERLAGLYLEAKGHFTSPTEFAVDGIETRALTIHKDGKLYRVSYYCDVCSIRTYSPGKCVCCQEETRLDLIDPSQN